MDKAEFFEALSLLEKEKGIPAEYLLEKIRAAIIVAVKKDIAARDTADNIEVTMDPETSTFTVGLRKTVVEEVEFPAEEMTLAEAEKYKKKPALGDEITVLLETRDFGRIAAQTAKQVIRQGIRDGERGKQLQEYQRKNQELITAVVTRIDPVTGNATLEFGHNQTMLPKSEQMPSDDLREGMRIKVYVVDVREGDRGPRMLISRTHAGLVRRLFEMEVPEIYNGTVEVKAISREAGFRTKLAVYAKDENVDAVGACIGPHGTRVANIVDELGGEKIDIVKYSDDPAEFISAALSPAKALEVVIDPDGAKVCRVVVPDDQLSLAIGNKGQNARLSAKLTGWKIDIRPESAPLPEEDETEETAEDAAE